MAKDKTSVAAETSNGTTFLQSKPWKVWMSIAPQPSAVLVSLYDLIFKDNGELYYDGSIDDPSTLRLRNLTHNILIYDTALYETGTGQLIGSASTQSFFEEGIDMGIPAYDVRAKKRKVTTHLNDKEVTFSLPDKDSAKYPATAEDLYTSNDWRQIPSVSTCAQLSEVPAGPLTQTNGGMLAVILASPDTVFDSTLVLEPTKKSYTQMCLNLCNDPANAQASMSSWDIINTVLKRLSDQDSDASWVPFPATPGDVKPVREALLEWVADAEGKDVLQHTYVWVKAAFAADYIDPKDFNQDLNQDANVIHKNLYASSFDSDYNRYDEFGKNLQQEASHKTAATTRGYIPRNAPLKDFVSHSLFASEIQGFDEKSLNDKIKGLEEASSLDNTNIGSVLSEPVKNKEALGYGDNVTPPQFFDSEARYASEEERTALGRVPVGLPKYGNVYTDGRIISPTVDELWYMLKKLISGRPSDTTVNPVTEDFGLLKGEDERANALDTSIVEVNDPFTVDVDGQGTKEGDPVNFKLEFDEDGNAESLKVTEFFSQPNVAVYHNFKDIDADSKYYKTFGTANKVVVESGAVDTGNTPTFTNIQIENISEDGIGKPDTIWAVREDPLSLRELEGRTLSLKYNLIKVYRDITKNFAMVGPLGKEFIYHDPVTGTDEVSSAGGLYQFHRDYNFDTKNPNTWFHMHGDKTGDPNKGGIDAEFGDLADGNGHTPEGEEAEREGNKFLYGFYPEGPGVDEKGRKIKTSAKPILRENYGMSHTLSEDDAEYYGSDVYLAADGTWRFRAEHMRLPILRSQF